MVRDAWTFKELKEDHRGGRAGEGAGSLQEWPHPAAWDWILGAARLLEMFRRERVGVSFGKIGLLNSLWLCGREESGVVVRRGL